MKSSFWCVMGCVGAVVGAGFVSGREVVFFFSQYGVHSWWLIGISILTMLVLADFLMRHGDRVNGLLCSQSRKTGFLIPKITITLVLLLLSGAMTSAAGEMIRLSLPFRYAYPAGLLGSLSVAWVMSRGEMKPFSIISFGLTALFLVMALLVMHEGRGEVPCETAFLYAKPTVGQFLRAVLYAVGYSAMNICVSMGFMCRSGCACKAKTDRRAAGFGLGMCGLLFLSNALYLLHPDKMNSAFPIVELFAVFGKTGFYACTALLYLAILTTLIALINTLRAGYGGENNEPKHRDYLFFCLIVLISQLGFSGIVNRFYAPMGLVCIAAVFLPLGRKIKKRY